MVKNKPFYKDEEFVNYIKSLLTIPMGVHQLEPLGLDREKLMNSL